MEFKLGIEHYIRLYNSSRTYLYKLGINTTVGSTITLEHISTAGSTIALEHISACAQHMWIELSIRLYERYTRSYRATAGI